MASQDASRREFLKNGVIAGQAVAAAALMGGLVVGREARGAEAQNTAAKRGPFKIGILGCGNRSKAHIAALNSVAEIEIAALCDVVPHKMDQRAKLIKKAGAAPQKYTEMEKMLAQADLDAVAIVLPNHLHKMAAVASLDAGKHVFCEKPMALTVPDCNAMIEAAKKSGKQLQIGTQRRHGPAFIAAIDTIRKADVGKILQSAVNSYRGDWRVPEADEYPPGTPYWRLNQEQCGGVVYEMGAHIIDLNNWVFDSEPVSIVSLQGVNDSMLRKRDSMDHGAVLVRYANDALMTYGGNLYTHGMVGADYFFAEKATIAIGEGKVDITYGNAKGMPGAAMVKAPSSADLPPGDGTSEQWGYFAKVLAGTAPAYPNGEDGRRSIQICQGSVIAAKEGRVVKVSELG